MRLDRTALALAAAVWLACGYAARAQDVAAPTPRIVIYPGDIIADDMLADLPDDTARGVGPIAESRAAVIGKMSRRTLLPGQAIPIAAVDNPRLVNNGGAVKLVFVDGELSIVTTGSALQDGAVGDLVKVRNDDSGVTVSGVVQPDGAVLVSGG
jgi:flagellar basal body P-ring formation protein FlgA